MADRTTLERAGVCLGVTYPGPIVDLTRPTRERALEAFKAHLRNALLSWGSNHRQFTFL